MTITSDIYRLLEFSPYTEMDLLSKVPIIKHASEEAKDLYELHSRLQEARSMNIIKVIRTSSEE